MANEVRISYEALTDTLRQALAAEGVPEAVREVEANIMAEADLLGVPSHGVRMLPGLIEAIRNGRLNPNPKLQLLRDGTATCLLDGDHGPGRYVSLSAMQQASERARRYGLGLCLARRVTHWGRAHAYAYRAAQAGMIGICATNAIPNMAGFGSAGHILGNNPLAVGTPRGAGRDPVVLDIAMSQAAVGKITTYLREGRPVPDGWGLDASGEPTNDPAAILHSGVVLPMGEHKGAGLSVMIEILTGALSGGLLSHESVRIDSTGIDPESSKFFLAINPEMFLSAEHFAERIDDLLANISAGFAPGQTWYYPGERGWQARDRYLKEGIPIHPGIVEQLEAIGITLPAA